MNVDLTPKGGASSYRYGTSGFAVAAIEVNLHRPWTGVFDRALDAAVKAFQKSRGLVVDGDVGPFTQKQLAVQFMGPVRDEYQLPRGMLLSIGNLESGMRVAAANFRQPGAIDLGWMQIHLPFPTTLANYLNAVYGPWCFGRTASLLAARRQQFLDFGKVTDRRRLWELAVLSHNWPAGAYKLARGEALSDQPAQWVIDIGATGVTTPAQWAEKYIALATRQVVW